MSPEEVAKEFIQGVESGKYKVEASWTGDLSEMPQFTFTVRVNKDIELLERLKEELHDLSDKRDRLDKFMSKNIFADLSYEEQYAMQRQREGMTEYMAALQKRIELIKERSIRQF